MSENRMAASRSKPPQAAVMSLRKLAPDSVHKRHKIACLWRGVRGILRQVSPCLPHHPYRRSYRQVFLIVLEGSDHSLMA